MSNRVPIRHGAHAVVIGGSMGGLLAARVLADHYDRVTVLERDALPDGPDARKGTPQARHIHVLLTAGFWSGCSRAGFNTAPRELLARYR